MKKLTSDAIHVLLFR